MQPRSLILLQTLLTHTRVLLTNCFLLWLSSKNLLKHPLKIELTQHFTNEFGNGQIWEFWTISGVTTTKNTTAGVTSEQSSPSQVSRDPAKPFPRMSQETTFTTTGVTNQTAPIISTKQ